MGLVDVKTNVQYQCWDKQQGYLVTDCCGIRRIGSVSLTQAFAWNVRTSRCNAKRKLQVRDTTRRKVSMCSTGAETSVVVMIAIER